MNGSRVRVKHGVEGPRHDPYQVTEYLVTRSTGAHGALRMGIGLSLNINGFAIYEDDEKKLIKRFEELCGCSLHVLEKAVHNAPLRRMRSHKCGMKHMREVAGYPGETFIICGKCGDVMDSHFNRSAIE